MHAARPADESRIGPLAGSGGASKQDQLFRESKLFAAVFGFKILPYGFKGQFRHTELILDMEFSLESEHP